MQMPQKLLHLVWMNLELVGSRHHYAGISESYDCTTSVLYFIFLLCYERSYLS